MRYGLHLKIACVKHESRKTCSHWAPSFWYRFPEEYISNLKSCRESGKAEINVPTVYSSKSVQIQEGI
nr:hypothetical protein CFP56_78880 [Quercus suber]